MSILTNLKSSSSSNQTPEEPKARSIKTRGFMMGQKMTPEQMETEIIRLSKTHKIVEIEKLTGKHRRTIERFLKNAKEHGKISNSKVTISDDEKAKRDYDKLSRNSLYEKYHPIKNWMDKRKAEAKGSKTQLRRTTAQLGCIKVICDTTRLNPHAMLIAGEDGSSYGGLEKVMSAFSNAMVEQKVVYQNKGQQQPDSENIASAFRNHLIAARNFATYNGVTIPKLPANHILSGKKVGFGQYAHIKLTWEQIDECVKLLSAKFGRDSFEVATFVFYYLTGTRNSSLYGVKTASSETNNKGWIVCRVYESKTRTTWKKYIPDDNPHFEIIENWIAKRRKELKPYLFSDDGKPSKYPVEALGNEFKEVYKKIGLTESYFYQRPTHGLRHVAAHYWLDRTGLNHAVVAKILGWKDVQTLIQCYGEITDEQIFEVAIRGALSAQ